MVSLNSEFDSTCLDVCRRVKTSRKIFAFASGQQATSFWLSVWTCMQGRKSNSTNASNIASLHLICTHMNQSTLLSAGQETLLIQHDQKMKLVSLTIMDSSFYLADYLLVEEVSNTQWSRQVWAGICLSHEAHATLEQGKQLPTDMSNAPLSH